MSSPLKNNITNLQELLQKVNSLPEAGVSGGINEYGNFVVNNMKTIGEQAFYNCQLLTIASFPVCVSIESRAFLDCTNLASVTFPACSYIGSYAFNWCTNLASVTFPACTSVNHGAFCSCFNLALVSLPVCKSIGSWTFASCYNLSQLYLNSSYCCTLSYSNAFNSTPYAGYSVSFNGAPYIYVPQSLLTSYKTATNWTYFSKYFSAICSDDTGDGIIIFTLNGITKLQAEEGMTWAEWVNSSYNTIGATNLEGYIYVGYYTISSVSPTDIIVSGKNYLTDGSGDSG